MISLDYRRGSKQSWPLEKLKQEGMGKILQRKHSGDLKSGLVWILNGQKEVSLQMVRILKKILNLKAQPFCQKPFEIKTKMSGFWLVQFSNGWDHSYSQTLWKPDRLKSFKKSGSGMIRFQIPTVKHPSANSICTPGCEDWTCSVFEWSKLIQLLIVFRWHLNTVGIWNPETFEIRTFWKLDFKWSSFCSKCPLKSYIWWNKEWYFLQLSQFKIHKITNRFTQRNYTW